MIAIIFIILFLRLAEARCPDVCTCPTTTVASCREKGLTAFPNGFGPNMEDLNLSYNKLNSIEYKDIAGLGVVALVKLNFSHNQIAHIKKDSFKGETVLKKVDLSWNKIRTLSPMIFTHTPHLEWLSLAGNENIYVMEYFLKQSSLIHLNLSSCGLMNVSINAFSGIPSIQELDLSHNVLKDIPRNLPSLSSLQQLWMEGNPLSCSCDLEMLDMWSMDDRKQQNVTCESSNCDLPCLDSIYCIFVEEQKETSTSTDTNTIVSTTMTTTTTITSTTATTVRVFRETTEPRITSTGKSSTAMDATTTSPTPVEVRSSMDSILEDLRTLIIVVLCFIVIIFCFSSVLLFLNLKRSMKTTRNMKRSDSGRHEPISLTAVSSNSGHFVSE